MQFLRALFAGMCLDGEGFARGEDLEEKGQRASHGGFEGGSVAEGGGAGGVGAHP